MRNRITASALAALAAVSFTAGVIYAKPSDLSVSAAVSKKQSSSAEYTANNKDIQIHDMVRIASNNSSSYYNSTSEQNIYYLDTQTGIVYWYHTFKQVDVSAEFGYAGLTPLYNADGTVMTIKDFPDKAKSTSR